MKDYRQEIDLYLSEEMEVLKKIDKETVNAVMNEIQDIQDRGSTLYVCGNGGSSATASHFACDFNKGVFGDVANNMNIVCLSDNTPMITAIANDISYDEIFSYQLKNSLKHGDVLMVISGSGNSKNIVRAMQVAKEQGIKIIGLCGYDGGKVKEMSDICLHVDINNMQITEDVHMLLCHCMMYIMAGYRYLKK